MRVPSLAWKIDGAPVEDRGGRLGILRLGSSGIDAAVDDLRAIEETEDDASNGYEQPKTSLILKLALEFMSR